MNIPRPDPKVCELRALVLPAARLIAVAAALILLAACITTSDAQSGSDPRTYLPILLKPQGALQRLTPADFQYLGAFRLPGDEMRPRTFEYGGNAMTFIPTGDPAGPKDGFSGSLMVMGHDRILVDVPDGGQVAEISIPVPKVSATIEGLPTAGFLQNFQNVTAGHFVGIDELPRAGMAYLDSPYTGPKIHIAWGPYLATDPIASHGWFNLTLSSPNFKGEWIIDGAPIYTVEGFMFAIAPEWASQNTPGKPLATGRFRDGGQGGMGPALFAYRPWSDTGATLANGARLSATPLLLYELSSNTESIVRAMNGYQHPDEWEGGAWIVTPSGKTAVLFGGTKSNGTKYWYGWQNPLGAQLPCVEEALVDQFPVCRLSNGGLCPPADLVECANHNDYRGWWSTHWDAWFILYDPNDLAQVAARKMNTWQPQPYATLDIDNRLYQNPSGVEGDMLGKGDQRRYRLGDMAYDRAHGILYVLEQFADGARPVIHVWKLL